MAAASIATKSNLSKACQFYVGTDQRTALQTATGDIFFTTRTDQELPELSQGKRLAFRPSPNSQGLYEVQLEGGKPSLFKKATTADWTLFTKNPRPFIAKDQPRTTGLQRQMEANREVKRALETAQRSNDAALRARFESLKGGPPPSETELRARFDALKRK